MSRAQPLDTLIGLARDQLDDATQQLGSLQGARLAAERQLEQLEQYLADYRSRLQQAVQDGLPAAGWQNYQRFIGVLEGAINEQRQVMLQSEQQLQAGREHWQAQQRRVHSFDALAERQKARQQLVIQRREQRAADEFSTRMMQRRASRSF